MFEQKHKKREKGYSRKQHSVLFFHTVNKLELVSQKLSILDIFLKMVRKCESLKPPGKRDTFYRKRTVKPVIQPALEYNPHLLFLREKLRFFVNLLSK